MTSLPILGYWNLRGRTEPIRYLLRYVGVPFNDKRYETANSWFDEKFTLGLDFPNVPYYIDGDIKLTQSLTIMKYLARKHGLIAKDDPTLARQELVEQQLADMKEKLYFLIMNADYLEKKPKYLKETLSPQLELLAKFLGSKKWLTEKFSYVDILAFETLDWFRLFAPETVAKFAILSQFLTRFENLAPIKAYRSSSEFKSWPLFGPFVHWGGKIIFP